MRSFERCRMWTPVLAALVIVLGMSLDANGAETYATRLETAPEIASARSDPAHTETLIRNMIAAAAEADGRVPVALALAVARVESNFDESAESSAGARGVMQIMPATAQDEYGVDPELLWDARTNIDLGVRFLGDLYDGYERDWDAALSHYNGGTLKNGRPHVFTASYVKAVNKWWRTYDSATSLQAYASNSSSGSECVCPKNALSLAPRRSAAGVAEESHYRSVTGDSHRRIGARDMTQEELIEHISAAKARVRAALDSQGAYD